MVDYNTSYSLLSAVREGRLEKAKELINVFGLSYSQAWSEGYVLLRDATRKKHTAVIKLLLTNGSKVNSKTKKLTDTPLHFAVINGDIEMVKMLVDRSAKINAKNQYGITSLHIAIKHKKIEIIELLLNHGANVNARNIDDMTPLHIAVKKSSRENYTISLCYGEVKQNLANINRDIKIVTMLLNKGANIDAQDQYGRTPLYYAIDNEKVKMSELLLNRGATVNTRNNDGITPLHIAAERGYLQIVECLLKHGVTSAHIPTFKESYTPLHLAVKNGHEKIVKLLLECGANLDTLDNDGKTILHFAVKEGHEKIVKLLLECGANVDAQDNDGKTILHFAVEKGYKKIVELLLECGANVDAQDNDGKTILHFAVKEGHEKIVKLLLECGANVDAQDNDGKTILHFAIEKGHLVIIEHILKYCPDINNKSNRSSLNAAVYGYKKKYNCNSIIVENMLQYDFTVKSENVNNCKLLHAAVKKGYLRIVKVLLKYGTDVNMLHNSTFGKGYTLLHTAIKNKQEAVAKLLISYDADVNAKDKTEKTPIFYAIKNADLKITKLLLTNRANVKDNPELLNIAVKKECREIVEILLQHGVDINASDTKGRTALHFTASSKDEEFFPNQTSDINVKGEIAKLLLSKGANVNAQTKSNITTLHVATKKGYVKVVEVLLEHNADVNCVDKSNITPLHFSVQEGNEVISKTLLNKGANVNAMQKNGITALHIATENGHEEIVKVLLKCGAKVDSKSEHDITPLHIAAQEDYLEIVKILLKFGASINSRDNFGKTALHIASIEGNIQTVIALLEHGSDINSIDKNNNTPLDIAILLYDTYNPYIHSLRNKVYRGDFDEDYLYYKIYTCNQIVKILKQHIVKMQTANLYVNKKNLLSINSNYELRDFQDECKKEVAIMKSEKINSNTNISFYNILTSTNRLAICMRTENIVQILNSNNYKTKFPIYASMIESNFRKGMQRKELLESANTTFYFLFNNLPDLPHDCIDKLFSYLSDEDLRILIDACKLANVSSPNIDINDVAIISNNISKVKEE